MPTENSVDAALTALRQAVAGLENAVDMRFEAERDNDNSVDFPPELTSRAKDPEVVPRTDRRKIITFSLGTPP